VPFAAIRRTVHLVCQLTSDEVGVVDDVNAVKINRGRIVVVGIDGRHGAGHNAKSGFLLDFTDKGLLRALSEFQSAPGQRPVSLPLRKHL